MIFKTILALDRIGHHVQIVAGTVAFTASCKGNFHTDFSTFYAFTKMAPGLLECLKFDTFPYSNCC